jgi:hypothetical protein
MLSCVDVMHEHSKMHDDEMGGMTWAMIPFTWADLLRGHVPTLRFFQKKISINM